MTLPSDDASHPFDVGGHENLHGVEAYIGYSVQVRRRLSDDRATREFGAELMQRLRPGDVVLLYGELGAGKTTLVRGAVQSIDPEAEVRSPTYNLMQIHATDPPVLHADLYRVSSTDGLDLEDRIDTHVSFVEWPDPLLDWFDPARCWSVQIAFHGSGRTVEVRPPNGITWKGRVPRTKAD